MKKQDLTLASALCLALCGCTPAPAPLQAHATVQELMQGFVDPAADALWEAVSTEVTQAGVEEKQPQTEADWLALRRHSLQLIEAASLLQVPGRAVVRAGLKLEDHEVPGISSPEQIHAAIQQDPAAFARAAQGLQQAALHTLAAIDARNVPRLLEAGAVIDQACEQCHKTYWYPRAATPPIPSAIKTTNRTP